MANTPALFDLDELLPEWEPIHAGSKAEFKGWQCRDCGEKMTIPFAGGARGGGVFALCEPCAQLDPDPSEPLQSRWGFPAMSQEDRDELERHRAARRHEYLAKRGAV